MICLEVSLLWQEFLLERTIFIKQNVCVCARNLYTPSGITCLSAFLQKDEIGYENLIKKKQAFPQGHWTLDHERSQFTSTSKFVAYVRKYSKIQHFFAEVILESREQRKAFDKSNLLFPRLSLSLFFLLSSFSSSSPSPFSSSSSLSLSLCLFLCLSLSLSFSASRLFLFIFLFFSCFSYCTFNKRLEVQKVTQSTC